jgi:hypothetical protein
MPVPFPVKSDQVQSFPETTSIEHFLSQDAFRFDRHIPISFNKDLICTFIQFSVTFWN